MTREELIAYDRWLTENKWGSSEIITPEQAADLYLTELPLPPAEGAEEILDKYPHSIEYPSFVHENSAIAAMTEFAALHAQRIAEKMVSERLREELFKFFEYEHAYTPKYLNSGHVINEYLKTREK